MAKIKDDLVGVVHVYVDGESVFLSAGAEVPAGAKVREGLLSVDSVVAPKDYGQGGVSAAESAAAAESASDAADSAISAASSVADTAINSDDGMPDEGDSREAWNIYAESVGVNPAEYSKKEYLIEALKQR